MVRDFNMCVDKSVSGLGKPPNIVQREKDAKWGIVLGRRAEPISLKHVSKKLMPLDYERE